MVARKVEDSPLSVAPDPTLADMDDLARGEMLRRHIWPTMEHVLRMMWIGGQNHEAPR